MRRASAGTCTLALLTTDPDEAGTFDLALVDMQMPEMDGIALAHALGGGPSIGRLGGEGGGDSADEFASLHHDPTG